MVLLPEKKDEAINQKFDMQTQLDSVNNMGWVGGSYLATPLSSFFVHKAKKMQKMVLKKKKISFNHMITFVLKVYMSSKQILL